MALNLVNQIGELNPQLFREIKGRLKPRNILIAVTLSLLGQLLVLMSFSAQLPIADHIAKAGSGGMSNRFCTGNKPSPYSSPNCILDTFGGVDIDWQLWWKDVFMALSIVGIIALLIVGSYMLISDLSKEEQRGTLNFLRLTPQSSRSILMGKMLGVPILLYLIGLLAFPLHLAAGLSAEINLAMILGFYTLVAASCLFFYSVALLFGLTGTWLGGFQPWLGGGAMLMFMWIMTAVTVGGSSTQTPADWILLFNPSTWLTYLTDTNSINAAPGYATKGFTLLKVWGMPVGMSAWSMLGVMLLNYGVWTYWAWVGLKRCFHNPKAPLFGKQQSYWLTACYEVAILGFAMNQRQGYGRGDANGIFENFQMVMVFNLLLFLGYIAALSPQRQAMQDWARYKHQHRSRKGGVMADLIWAEKSPAIVAIALNLAIASSILLTWVIFLPTAEQKLAAVFAVVVNISLILVYATIAQLILLMKSPKSAALAAGAVGLLIIVPPLMISFLARGAVTYSSDLWLFSAFPWVAVKEISAMNVFMAVIGQSLATGLLSLQLTKKLRKAGESSTKALRSGRSPVAVD